MDEKKAYEILRLRTPKGFKINELIKFGHPYWTVQMEVLVNKQPEKSLLDVYRVILRAISMGLSTKEKLFHFLGLSSSDEFIERELFGLRKDGMLDFSYDSWIVTERGSDFLNDSIILSVQESENYQFLIDGISGQLIPKRQVNTQKQQSSRHTDFSVESSDVIEIVRNSSVQLSEVYKSDNPDNLLIDYDPQDVRKPRKCWTESFLIEYVSVDGSDSSYIEIRYADENLTIDRRLGNYYNDNYVSLLKTLSESDRFSIPRDREDEFIGSKSGSARLADEQIVETLSVWETKQKFIESLKTVQSRILIESPWIKRATLEYIQYFRSLLKDGKKLYILYGIEEYDHADHHEKAMSELRALRKDYSKQFKLIHLPSHFGEKEVNLTGSHKKLVIKDDEYYIVGSFNFLSFGKQSSDKVANEESTLIKQKVHDKWTRVGKEYQMKFD